MFAVTFPEWGHAWFRGRSPRHKSPKAKLKARVPDVKGFIKTAQRDGKDYSSLNRDRIE